MTTEIPPRAMGYVCVDLVKTVVGLDYRARQIAARLGYEYIGLTTSCSLIVPEALLDHVSTVEVELLIVPSILHLRGRIPPDLAAITDIHDLSTGRNYERGGGYAPDGGIVNPLVVPDDGEASPREEDMPRGDTSRTRRFSPHGRSETEVGNSN